ncbi:hypothetical protein [Halobellus captivus]|uniref:hypothetical protein n=1 Tax=Halobellus captivus TaxID=2592614 RepID=UPI00119F6AA6|nr:hypothetical protein [Halobellus captivus]
MPEEPSVRELPGALVDYAAGVVDVVARGLIAVAIATLLLAAIGFAVVGGGVSLLLLAVFGPAIVAAIALEVPSRLRKRLE